MSELEEIEELLKVCDHLLGPGGCPWDREQTMMSARSYVLEEVSELIEAIDLGDDNHIEEELGDLFFNAVFLSRLAEKEGRTSLSASVKRISEKLVRRHPHVFGDLSIETSEEVVHQWEHIKKQEKGNSHRKSALDGIPKGLPALSRAMKMIKRMKKQGYPDIHFKKSRSEFKDEEELGKLLWDIVYQASERDIDSEHALRTILAVKEMEYREYECEQ